MPYDNSHNSKTEARLKAIVSTVYYQCKGDMRAGRMRLIFEVAKDDNLLWDIIEPYWQSQSADDAHARAIQETERPNASEPKTLSPEEIRRRELKTARNARNRAQKEEKDRERSEAIQKNFREVMKGIEEAIEAKHWLDQWKLSDGTPIMLATRDKLIEESKTEDNLMNGHRLNARFYSYLAENVPKQGTLGDAMSKEDVIIAHNRIFAALPPPTI